MSTSHPLPWPSRSTSVSYDIPCTEHPRYTNGPGIQHIISSTPSPVTLCSFSAAWWYLNTIFEGPVDGRLWGHRWSVVCTWDRSCRISNFSLRELSQQWMVLPRILLFFFSTVGVTGFFRRDWQGRLKSVCSCRVRLLFEGVRGVGGSAGWFQV